MILGMKLLLNIRDERDFVIRNIDSLENDDAKNARELV